MRKEGRKSRTLRSVLCLSLAVLLLAGAGCRVNQRQEEAPGMTGTGGEPETAPPEREPESASPSPAELQEPSQPQEPPEPPEPPEPQAKVLPRLESPAMRLASFSDGYLPTVVSLGGGEVLLCEASPLFLEAQPLTTTLSVMDVFTGAILRTRELAGRLIPLQNWATGGRIAFADYESRVLTVLDRELSVSRTWAMDELSGLVSADGLRYYWVRREHLWMQDLETGELQLLRLPEGLSPDVLWEIHPQRDRMLLSVYRDPYSTDTLYAAWEPGSDTLCGLYPDAYDACLGDRGVFAREYVGEDAGRNWSERQWLIARGREEGVFDLALPGSEEVYTDPIPGSDYVLCVRWASGETDDPPRCSLCRLEADGGEAELAPVGLTARPEQFLWLPEERLVVFGFLDDDGNAELWTVDPGQLSYGTLPAKGTEARPAVDQEVLRLCREETAPVPLATELSELRRRADELEECFGIRILMSAECARFCELDSRYTEKLTDGLEDEAELIAIALETLERCLSRYPEGFFRQFREPDGSMGIRILLVGAIRGEEMETDFLGYEFYARGWENVAVDISWSYSDLDVTVYHELWHAMEDEILERQTWMFSDGWWRFNPSDFNYMLNYTSYDSEGHEETFWGNVWENDYDPERVYFVDTYGRVSAQEDRARIMESVMSWDEEFIEAMLRSSHVAGKLHFMCQAVRSAFDTTGWTDVPWERWTEGTASQTAQAA